MQTQRFNFTQAPLQGVFQLTRNPIKDERGFLTRFFCHQEFLEIGIDFNIAQVNHTKTKNKATIRGMHFQLPPYSEKKLVSCIKGKVFDVAVDLRKDSETFLQWFGMTLSADEQNAIFIPEGFAHGFQSLEEDCEMMYLHSSYYQPASEDGVRFNDPALSISWPLPVSLHSERDGSYQLIQNNFKGITV